MVAPVKAPSDMQDELDFSNLVDTLSWPVLVYMDSRPIYANEAWLDLVSITLDQIVAFNHLDELVHWIEINDASESEASMNGLDVGVGQRIKLHLTGRDAVGMDAVQQTICWQGQSAGLLIVLNANPVSNELAAERQRLLDFSRVTKDWFWEIDSELRYSWFSENIEQVMGYPPQWFYGHRRSDFLSEEEIQETHWVEHLATLERREAFEDFVFQVSRRDGELRWIRISGAPFYDAAGNFSGFRGTGSDINDMKLLEIALRTSEGRFRQFADVASDWYWEMDENLRFTYLTENTLERLGKPASFFVGKTRLELFGDGLLDDPKWAEHYALLARREPFRDFVYTAVGSDEITPTWLRVNGSPIFSDDGRFEGYRGSATVITEQVRDQIARENSEKRFREFSELAADWFWELDKNLKFSYLSDRFQEICGVEPDRLIGMSAGELEGGYPRYHAGEDEDTRSIVELLKQKKPFEGWQFNWRHPDGRILRIAVNARPIFDEAGKFSGYRGVATDVTQKHELSVELEFQANHDVLTGLYNRREFDRFVQLALDKAHRDRQSSALLYIDLDQFKVVNDSVGHQAGDELIKRISSLISSQIKNGDVVARLGGDEFGVLLTNCAVEDAMAVASLMAETIREFTFTWDGQAFRVSTSIGVVSIDEDTESVTEVLSQADVACYAAKDAGRNQISRYEEHNEAAKRQHNQILQAAGIRDSLNNDRFRLFKQVILPINSSAGPLRFELLLRLLDESGRIIAPGAVIPAAERFGLMPSIDRWVLKTALENLNTLRELHPGCVVNINLSGTTISDASLPGYVESLLATYETKPGSVCFEVTETALISNLNIARSTIRSVREMGHCFALDDFGSGMSSFAYLKHLPVDYLKIDGSFVRDIESDETDYAVVAAINDVAHRIGIQTIAEFVENEGIVARLRDIGVDYGQGYGLGKPVPLDNVHDVISTDSLMKKIA